MIQGLQCRRWTAWRRLGELDAMLGEAPPEEGLEETGAAGIEPDFGTLADTNYAQRAFGFGDFSWYVKKRYAARLIEPVLLKRGFEAKTARILAKEWDAWRFHPENGQPLVEGAPLSLSDGEIVGLAEKMPECLRDLANSTCKLAYSIEIGCRLDPPMAKTCRRRFDLSRVIAAAFAGPPEKEETFMLQASSYQMAGCIYEGGKGAGVPVFAPDTAEAVTKLVFVAQPGAKPSKVEVTSIEAMPQRQAPTCTQELGLALQSDGGYHSQSGSISTCRMRARISLIFWQAPPPRRRFPTRPTETTWFVPPPP